jgi:hypothetical protein
VIACWLPLVADPFASLCKFARVCVCLRAQNNDYLIGFDGFSALQTIGGILRIQV